MQHDVHVRRYFSGLAAFLLVVACNSGLRAPLEAVAASDPGEACVAQAPVQSEVFLPDGFGSNWSHVNNRIAFNRADTDGLYHVFTVEPDGSDEERLGASDPSFPQRTTGSPMWHPSGKYLAFVAEKEVHPGNSVGSLPGWGGYSDLWLATADGSQVWQLTDTPTDKNHGTLLPEFSPDGRFLEWTERIQAPNPLSLSQFAGFWIIKIADFIDDPNGPHLTNISTVSPTGDAFNETGGFTADGSGLVFTSNSTTGNFLQSEIFYLDLAGGHLRQLTSQAWVYNEHPRFTPDARVIWMSDQDQGAARGGTDWWIMNPDGSHKARLTYFNDPSRPEYAGQRVWATVVPTANWSDDGTFFYGDVELNLITGRSEIVRVSVTCAGVSGS
jgi:Tol biopolymer transport system component